MSFVIEAEATSTEYHAIVEWDHDEETLEYYPQVEPIKISYLSADGKRRISIFTKPDALRITRSRISFVECKTEEELVSLAKDQPNRYQCSNGRWRSPPAEAAAAEFGCDFEIRSSAQNNWTLHENVELLKEYYIGELPVVSAEVKQRLRDRFAPTGWISMFDLIHMEPAVLADDVYAQIVRREVFFPLDKQRLSDQERALVFRDEATYRAHAIFLSSSVSAGDKSRLSLDFAPGSLFTWDGQVWRVINPGDSVVTIQRVCGAAGAAFQLDCNRASGEWKATPATADARSGQLIFGAFAGTRAICAPGSLDQQLSRQLPYVRSYLFQDGQLHMSLFADGGILHWAPRQ